MMIACCTPLVAFADESLRTLQYACSAGSIRNRPVVKLDPQDQLISELRDEVQQLKATVRSLRRELSERQTGGGGLERNLSEQSLSSMYDRYDRPASRAESRSAYSSSSRADLRDGAARGGYAGRTPLATPAPQPTPAPHEARSVVVSLSELPDESPPKQLSAGYREHTDGLAPPYRVPAAYQSPRREEYDDQVALIEARAAAEAR